MQLSDSPFFYRIQRTLANPISLEGISLHAGTKCKVCIRPAQAHFGIRFVRTDLKAATPFLAHYKNVQATDLATTLGDPQNPDQRVSTVEHLVAALFALGVSNALIEVDGPECPILDGSAKEYVTAIMETGLTIQFFTTETLRIHRPVRMQRGPSLCELLPRDRLRATSTIHFAHPLIGEQTFGIELTPKNFVEMLAEARTFGFVRDLEKLKALNLAKGASLENTLAFMDDGTLMESQILRHANECVRHKILDAIGDLALCGKWIEGELVSVRGGHSIHLAMLNTLERFEQHWDIVQSEPVAPLSVQQSTSALSPELTV